MTLLEVLFAITVASVGLLGAIAVFPLALAQARKGRLADTTSIGAQAAVAKFHAESMRRPDRWRYFNEASDATVALSGTYNNSYQRAFVYPPSAPQSRLQDPNFFYPPATPFGAAFCIDPRFFIQNQIASPSDGTLWSFFPAVPDGTSFNAVPPINGSNATTWGRMLRLSLSNGNSALASPPPMSYVQADNVFRIEDELLYERPKDNTLPAVQLFSQVQTAAGPPPTFIAGRRQEEGRLTWMATLSPKVEPPHSLSEHVFSLPDKGINYFVTDSYVLSVVVYYNRSPDLVLSVPGSPRPFTEWTAKIRGGVSGDPNGGFFASGIGGGEVRIRACNNTEFAAFNSADSLALNSGSWIALSRTVPVVNRSGVKFGPDDPINQWPDAPPYVFLQHLQWYRVSDVDEVASDAVGLYRDVTLVGPDWPIDVFDNSNYYEPGGDGFAEECDVIIVSGVQHVYERSIKLERGAAE